MLKLLAHWWVEPDDKAAGCRFPGDPVSNAVPLLGRVGLRVAGCSAKSSRAFVSHLVDEAVAQVGSWG